MQVVLHAGAHKTDDDLLLRCLLSNRKAFAEKGIAVPEADDYRQAIRNIIIAMGKGALVPGAREEVLADILGSAPEPDRLLLSNQHFFSVPRMAVNHGVLYPNAEVKLERFSTLFAKDDVELFLAIRNPATFYPAIFAQAQSEDFLDFMGGADPRHVFWSELITRLRQAVPRVPITVWCNEDTPMLWAQILRDMAGLEHNAKIKGGFDLLTKIMSKEGMQRFRGYLKEHPSMNEIQKRRVIAAFLDKFALDDELEEEVDLPGWTDELVDSLSDIYDEDVFQISRIPGVTLIAP